MSTSTFTSSDKKKFVKATDALVVRGDYKAALAVAKDWRAARPNTFWIEYQYAKLLGDWADELPPARKKKLKAESIAILKRLMADLRGQDVTTRWRLPLNYYYQSEDWAGMYAFGQKFARTDRRLAAYTKGLAASYLAEKEKSKTWGRRGVSAWTEYGLARESYYFAHYSMAKALAYAGQFDEARTRLAIAAKKGKRPITDWEFADVLRLLPPPSSSRSPAPTSKRSSPRT